MLLRDKRKLTGMLTVLVLLTISSIFILERRAIGREAWIYVTYPSPSSILKSSKQNAVSSSSTWYITIPFTGRLGNKMFQYASLLGLAHQHNREPFVLATDEMVHYFKITYTSVHDVRWWLTVKENLYATNDPVFDSLPSQNLKIEKYLQSWKYFSNISDVIVKQFTFQEPILKEGRIMLETLLQRVNRKLNRTQMTKIAVHVRLTDKNSQTEIDVGNTVASKSYLEKAIQYMESKHGRNAVFVVVSDDLLWCNRELQRANLIVADMASPIVHLALASLCDHVIMTVGTFGWWAAYLAGGDVVYYKNFPRPQSIISVGFTADDYFMPHWVPLGD